WALSRLPRNSPCSIPRHGDCTTQGRVIFVMTSPC
ncbi:hypothetical protein GJ496_010552, partial [Pomphorhynchus laevis]